MNDKFRKPRVLLFLGAGASCFAGYRAFVTFPELLFNPQLRKAEGMPPLYPNSERILKAIKESLIRNNKATTHDNFLKRLNGYMQFLRLYQSDDTLQYFLENNTRLGDLSMCTEQAIGQICATTVRHYSANLVKRSKHAESTYNKMRSVLSLYCQLARLNGDPPWLPVFTTNYDMLMEDLVSEFGKKNGTSISVTNGVPGVVRENAGWDEELMYSGEKSSGIYLHRLHGCVCWFYNPSGNGVTFIREKAAFQEMPRMCAMYPGKEGEHVGNDPYGFAFKSFYRYLLECDLAIFIGFSFRDDDVTHILLKAMEERGGKLKLLAVDPLYTSDDIRNKLIDAAGRTTFPSRIPESGVNGEIYSMKPMPFGENENTDFSILKVCKEIL